MIKDSIDFVTLKNDIKMLRRLFVILFMLEMGLIIAIAIRHEIREKLQSQLISRENELTQEENYARELSRDIKEDFSEAEESQNQAVLNANKALEQVVCSDANRYNAHAQKEWEQYQKSRNLLEEELQEYKDSYTKVLKLEKEINDIQQKLDIEETQNHLIKYNDFAEKFETLENKAKKKGKIVKKSKQFAKKLYEAYYTLMVLIVTGECGDYYYPDIDQYYVMNVIENRIKSKYYPNTIRGVIFQEGQYQPTWDGSWSKTPSERTKRNVKKYLLGKVDTGMPDNVLYQAMFIQGKDVWTHVSNPVDSGHWYCIR